MKQEEQRVLDFESRGGQNGKKPVEPADLKSMIEQYAPYLLRKTVA